MDSLVLSDRWTTPLSEDLTKLIVYDFFKQNNIVSKDFENGTIFGSYRLSNNPDSILKSTLIKSSELPAKFEIKIMNVGDETELNLKMQSLYTGSGFGMKRKYKNLFGKLINQLKIKLFEKEKQKEIRPICPNCGVRGFENKNQRICEKCGFELKEK